MWIPLLVFLGVITLNIVISVYAERKLSAFIQDRLGPMEVGKWGTMQLFADMLKLLQKEDILTDKADRMFFKLAPYIIFGAVFTGYAFIPINPLQVGSNIQTGLFFLLGIIAIDVLGILMAGWSSNNKYSLLGAFRSALQMISYEVPIGLAILAVVIASGSLNLQEISIQQGIFSTETLYLFGIKKTGIEVNEIGGFLAWNLFLSPFLFIAFIIFIIAGLAEANRAPFDLPEAESELVAGFNTEYSGFRWAILFLAEYGMMLLLSLLASFLFLGGWNTPLPNIGSLKLANWTSGIPAHWTLYFFPAFWLSVKTYIGMLVQMWVRWTLPRLRIDQLMYLCWKVLTPIGLIVIVIVSAWKTLSFF